MSKLHTIKTIHEFNQIVARENTVVDFYRPGCKPCEAIIPKLEKMAVDYPHYVFIKVDIEANPDIAYLFSVQSVPTFAVFEKNALQMIDYGTAVIQIIENNIKATLPANEHDSDHGCWQIFDPNC